MTPAGVRELTLAGHDVLVETGAGEGSAFPDDAYRAAGARLASVDDVWGEAELLLPPDPEVVAAGHAVIEPVEADRVDPGVPAGLVHPVAERGVVAGERIAADRADDVRRLAVESRMIARNAIERSGRGLGVTVEKIFRLLLVLFEAGSIG